MSIVSSTYTLGAVARDGRRECTELHTDQIGKVHRWVYRGIDGWDARILVHAAMIWDTLVRNEINAALQVDASPTLVYATKTDFVPAYRQAYKDSERDECGRLATWILNRITDGWVTDTQVRNAFGLTAGEWTTLKTKMQTLSDHWLAVQAARGE